MLTSTEKQILGYMVDMGSLRRQDRLDAGQNDETARSLIAAFSAQMQMLLPMQISNLQAQQQRNSAELETAQQLFELLSSG